MKILSLMWNKYGNFCDEKALFRWKSFKSRLDSRHKHSLRNRSIKSLVALKKTTRGLSVLFIFWKKNFLWMEHLWSNMILFGKWGRKLLLFYLLLIIWRFFKDFLSKFIGWERNIYLLPNSRNGTFMWIRIIFLIFIGLKSKACISMHASKINGYLLDNFLRHLMCREKMFVSPGKIVLSFEWYFLLMWAFLNDRCLEKVRESKIFPNDLDSNTIRIFRYFDEL